MALNQNMNAHALGVLINPIDIPDFHLMVGSAEFLGSFPIMIYRDYLPNEVVKNLQQFSEMTNEDIQQAIADNVLEVNDLNGNTSLLGDGLGVL